MNRLYVRINDLYTDAYFHVDAPAKLTADNIRQALEQAYDSFKHKLIKVGGGSIFVWHHGKLIAKGAIMWWFLGGHAITINEMYT